ERCDAAVHAHAPLVGQEDTCDELQQRRLALTVAADDADRLAGAHVERHVAKRPELTRPAAPRRVREQILEVPTPATISTEPDAEIAHLDGDVGRESRVGHHSSFSTGRSRRRNTNTPRARNASDIAAPTT